MPFSLKQRVKEKACTEQHWFSPILHQVGNAGSTGSVGADLVPIVLLAQHADENISLKCRTWGKIITKIHFKFLLAIKSCK